MESTQSAPFQKRIVITSRFFEPRTGRLSRVKRQEQHNKAQEQRVNVTVVRQDIPVNQSVKLQKTKVNIVSQKGGDLSFV